MIFGSPSAAANGASIAPPTLEIRDNEKRSMPIKWNQTVDSLGVPSLPDKYVASDYEAGSLQTSNFVSRTTEVGAEGISAAFVHNPRAGVKKMPVTVTYQLTVEKAEATPLLLGSGTGEMTYGDTPKGFAFADMVETKGNEAYFVKGNVEPVLTDGTGTVITAADARLLPVASTVTATYKATLDEQHYLGAAEAPYSIIYTVVSKSLPQTESKPENQNLLIGAGFTLPDAKPAEEHYALKTDLPKTEVTERPDTAKNAPAIGSAIDADQVNTYEKGTKFTVTYTYTVADGNFTGPDYTVVYNYTVGDVPATKPAEDTFLLPSVNLVYGQIALSAPPATPVLGIGYDGSYANTSVTKQSTVTGANSPSTATAFDWTKVNDYNAGTEFDLTYAYEVNVNYKGDPFIAKRHYVISKQTVTIPDDTSDTAVLSYAADVTTIAAPSAINAEHFGTPVVAYYKDVNGVKTPISADAVKTLAAGSSFTAEWTFHLLEDNYKPATTKASYKATTTYTIEKAAISYASNKTVYGPTTRIYKHGLEDTVPTALPDTVQGAGYVYKSATYKITKKSNDGKTPLGAVTDLTNSANYGAGTIVTATYVFTPDGNHKGADVIATGAIEVLKKPGVKPADSELVGTNTDKTYSEEQIQPVYSCAFEGWIPGKSTGKVTVRGTGSPAVNTTVTWTNFKTYGPGTVVTVSYPFTADTYNYADITGQINYTQTLTVVKRTVVLPTTAELQNLQTVKYEYKTDVKKPSVPVFPGKGYIGGVLTSAVVSKRSSVDDKDSPAVGTEISWPNFKTYNSGTEIKVTFTYKLDSTTYENESATYELVQKYVIVKAGAVPVFWTREIELPDITYKHGTTFKLIAPQPPKKSVGYGLGWVYLSVVNYNLVSKSWGATYDPFDWTKTDQYPAGTVLDLYFEFSRLPNYEDRPYYPNGSYALQAVRNGQKILIK